jgi:hypothetical protein
MTPEQRARELAPCDEVMPCEEGRVCACHQDLAATLEEADAQWREGLEESVKLQGHYAGLLNMYDDGKRLIFKNAEEWLQRLRALKAAKRGEEDQ